jgi:hypothetical protein
MMSRPEAKLPVHLVNLNDFPRQPISILNVKHLSIPEIRKDYDEAIVPTQTIREFHNAFLTPINHIYLNGKYVKTGIWNPFDDKFLPWWKQHYLFLKFRFFTRVEKHRGEFIWATDLWSGNYYHWLCESLPRLYKLKLHVPSAIAIIPYSFKNIPFIKESLDLLGIAHIYLSDGSSHFFESLYTVESDPPWGNVNPELHIQFRDELVKRAGISDNKTGPRKIYISREKAARRKISNETQIISMLTDHGYEIIHAENIHFKDQIKLFSEANYLLGQHGAGHTNLMFMKPGSRVMEIRQEDWNSQPFCFLRLANIFDLEWNYLNAKSVGQTSNFSDTIVDLKMLSFILSKQEKS